MKERNGSRREARDLTQQDIQARYQRKPWCLQLQTLCYSGSLLDCISTQYPEICQIESCRPATPREKKSCSSVCAPHGCVSCHKTTHSGRTSVFIGSGTSEDLNSQFGPRLPCLCMWPLPGGGTFAQWLQVFLERKVISGLHGLAVMSRALPHPPGSGQV